MMKKILFLFFIIFFIYVISPYYSIYKFYKSVKQSDIEFVSKNVNWIALRNGFKIDFNQIINKAVSKKSNIEEKILGNLFVQLIIEALVENLVTPENLILLVNDPDKYKNLIEDKIESPIKKINYIQKIGYKKNNLEIKYVFFINVNKFRLSFIKDEYPIIIDLKLNSFKWKLDRVHLPIDLLVSKINN